MPYPLPKGRKFSITYLKTDATHHMPTMCATDEYYEMSFLISGDRKSVTSRGIYFTHPGSVSITEPGLMHQTASISDEDYSRILIKFSNDIAHKIRQDIGSDIFNVLCQEHIHYFHTEETLIIKNFFDDMRYEYEHYTNYTEALLTGMLLRLLILVNRSKIPSTRPTLVIQEYNEIIDKALRYIDCHVDEELSLTKIADYTGLSPAYFSRLFKKVTGTTFTDYVNVFKILIARTLIMQTSMTLNEIALETGFSNGNYLSNSFHKHFHMTPTQYKKTYADSESYPD